MEPQKFGEKLQDTAFGGPWGEGLSTARDLRDWHVYSVVGEGGTE